MKRTFDGKNTFDENDAKEWLTQHLRSWQVRNGALCRVYETGSWRLTMLVANHIAFIAEAADHHPELILNYSTVEVHLKTHSVDAITQKDFELAQQIEKSVMWRPSPESDLGSLAPEQWLKLSA